MRILSLLSLGSEELTVELPKRSLIEYEIIALSIFHGDVIAKNATCAGQILPEQNVIDFQPVTVCLLYNEIYISG